MIEEIYQPPQSKLNIPRKKSGSIFKGVIFGGIVDIVGTITYAIVFGIAYAIVLTVQGKSESEITTIVENFELYSVVGLLSLPFAFLISYYAGYLCAKKSGGDYKKSTAILCVISGAFGFIVGFETHSLLDNIVLTILTVLAIVYGSKRWKSKCA